MKALILISLLLIPVGLRGQGVEASKIRPSTVARLGTPPATAVTQVRTVTDGNSATDCTVGGGLFSLICKWNGSAWVALPTVASGGTSSTIVVGTTPITSGTANRVLFHSAAGDVVSEDGDFTFLTDTLTVTKQVIGGGSAITSSGAGGALGALSFVTPGTGVATASAVNAGSAGAFVVNGGALGSPSSAGTIPALTLGGTVSGGGNQLNNVVIGTTTPLAGFFTTLGATGTFTAVDGLFTPANTTGNGVAFNNSVLTTGNTVSITASGTTAASNTKTGLNVATSGVNATNAMTTYGAQITNTSTNATSGTNIALLLSASGATTSNKALSITGGQTSITPGTLVDLIPGLSFTATMPTTMTGENDAILATITTAGSSSQVVSGFTLNLNAGYTGSSYTVGSQINNTAAGTGTSVLSSSSGGPGNYGTLSGSTATTTGDNVGVTGLALGGNRSYGVVGLARGTKNSATFIGVVGMALNGGTSPIQIGGYFGLQTANPTFPSTPGAALVADNGAVAADIIVARDNGTAVFRVGDGGTVFIPNISTSSGLQTAVLCQSSGGEMIADSVACLASTGRAKLNVQPLQAGLKQVMALNPVSFTYKPEGIFANNVNFKRERVGLIAEDVFAVDPRLVGYEADGVTPRTVAYDQLTPMLINAIKEQQDEIAALNARLKTLWQRLQRAPKTRTISAGRKRS